MIGTTAYTAEITETYGYAGKQGRVSVRDTAAQVTAPFIGIPASFTQSWTWNDLGDVASVSYPVCTHAGCTATAIRTVTPGYTNGFLTSVPGYTSPSAPNGRPITYHPNGQVNQIYRANDTTDTYTKDPQNQARPRKIETRVTSSGIVRWSSALLSYDGAGNLTRAGNAYSLYDPASRVKDGLLYLGPGSGGTSATFDHAYDGFGNLQSLTTNTTMRNTPTSATTNRLTGTAVYDAAGNLTSWSGATYQYDALSQMWNMKNGAEDWYYLYTADGERLWSFQPATRISRWTVRDLDGKVLREYKNDGTTWSIERDYVYRGSQLLAAHTPDPAPNDLIHLHLDHLGTPRAITNRNAVRTDYHIYFPFGEEASSPTQNVERMKFTGHERDLGDVSSPADDLDYMHARFYNPQTGRFLSTDPIDSAVRANAQSWNKYAYALDNPLRYKDPEGELPNAVIGGAIGGLLGGAGSIISQTIQGSDINWRDVGAAAAGGAVSGALAGATLGLSLVVEGGGAAVVAVSAASNAAGGAVTRALDSSAETKAGDAKEVAIDLSSGAAGGVLGLGAEKVVKVRLPQIGRQIEASRPGARQGSFSAAQSV